MRLQRYAVTLDHPASCSIDASLEELRKKIMDAAKCALPKSTKSPTPLSLQPAISSPATRPPWGAKALIKACTNSPTPLCRPPCRSRAHAAYGGVGLGGSGASREYLREWVCLVKMGLFGNLLLVYCGLLGRLASCGDNGHRRGRHGKDQGCMANIIANRDNPPVPLPEK